MELLNKQVSKIRYARALVKGYNQIQDSLAELKVSHKVSEFMGQSERSEQIMEEMEKAMGAGTMLEEEMVEVFAELEGVQFMTDEEWALLPDSVTAGSE